MIHPETTVIAFFSVLFYNFKTKAGGLDYFYFTLFSVIIHSIQLEGFKKSRDLLN